MNRVGMEMAEDQQQQGGSFLHTLYSPEQGSCQFDVVAVHGLDGDYLESWSHKPRFRASTMWLRDLLPEKLPNCHVMTFQYDGRSIGPNAYGVREVAANLLQSLRDIRQEHGCEGRSIVMIGHSLGGIVIKMALARAYRRQEGLEDYTDIANSTKGIMFFGTPHLGSEAAHRLERLKNINGAVTFRNTSEFLTTLRSHSTELGNLSEDFSPHASKYAIISYFERDVHPLFKELIVDKTSAELGLTNEECSMIGGHHVTICKFGRGDKRFERVWKDIRRIAKGP